MHHSATASNHVPPAPLAQTNASTLLIVLVRKPNIKPGSLRPRLSQTAIPIRHRSFHCRLLDLATATSQTPSSRITFA